MTSPLSLPPTTRTRIRQRGRKSKGNCKCERMVSGLISNQEGGKELTIIAALWFYLSYYDSKTHRRTSACWLAFGLAIYARYIHQRLLSPRVAVLRSVPRAARGTNRPSRRSLLSTASRLRFHRERSSVCWDRT